jgi:MFS family permease
MFKRQSYSLYGLADRSTLLNIILIANALIWYYIVLTFLEGTITNVGIWAVHFSGLILSALVGASVAKRIERSRFLIIWMCSGVVSSILLFTINSPSMLIIALISLFLGVSLGFGMPTCMSYFTDTIPVESRGRVSGITMLVSGIGIFAFGSAQISDALTIGVILAAWRSLSLIVFWSAKNARRAERKHSFPSYRGVFGQQSFILYFVPWIMFSLVNYLAAPLAPKFSGATFSIALVQTVFLGGSAILGGFLVDSVGRRRIAIAGFALLGLGTASLGIFPSANTLVLYFNATVDGIAWGFLLVLFILTLWGDLSHSFSSDKYYALGVLPFFVSKFLDFTVGAYILDNIKSSAALFSFTAFFLFLAVLPLFYAPETLPEKTIKEKELAIYLEEAQKIKEKYS